MFEDKLKFTVYFSNVYLSINQLRSWELLFVIQIIKLHGKIKHIKYIDAI